MLNLLLNQVKLAHFANGEIDIAAFTFLNIRLKFVRSFSVFMLLAASLAKANSLCWLMVLISRRGGCSGQVKLATV